MKRFLIASLLTGFAFAAAAQTSGSVTIKDEANRPVGEMPAATAADVTSSDYMADRSCLRHTGSHLLAADSRRAKGAKGVKGDRADQCANANGSAYTREDINQTGEVNLSDALRKLDPSIH